MRRWTRTLRRNWRRIVGVAALCGVGILAGAMAAAVRSPAWYAPSVVAPEDRQKVRNNLVAAEQAFTEGLRTAIRPFEYQLLQDDVNQWIAMRREIYPLIDELAPPQLDDPFVVFREGTITIAGRYRTGVLNVVLSVDIVPTLEDGWLVLRAGAVRCGSVRLPLSFGAIGLRRPIERDREETWPGSPRMNGDFVNGLRLESEAWWKNGGSAYRLLDVRVEPGRLRLEIEPLGRRQPAERRPQD